MNRLIEGVFFNVDIYFIELYWYYYYYYYY